MKYLASLVFVALTFGASYYVMVSGWGLQVHSWGALIGVTALSGFFGILAQGVAK